MNLEGWNFNHEIIGRSQVGIAFGTAHYMIRYGKRFWNDNATYIHNPRTGCGMPEAYYYNYKSLCGRHHIEIPTRTDPKFFKTVIPKAKPCRVCLLLLAKRVGIV